MRLTSRHAAAARLRCSLLLLGTVYFLGMPGAQSLPIGGLWNTGVDSQGNPLAAGALESHYSGTLPTGSNPAYQMRTVLLPGTYVRNPADAAWIGPSLTPTEGALVDDPVGEYRYGLAFDLTGLSAASAMISGLWASDNNSSIWLNGVNTGLKVGFEQFGRLTSFSIFDGMLGLNGLPIHFSESRNTLEFLVYNGSGWGNPSALLVSQLAGSAQGVPDQGSLLMLLGGAFLCLIPVSRALRR